MSKIFIEETTLTKIADAIRTKLSTSEPIPVLQMDGKILSITSGGGGNIPAEALKLTGGCDYKFFNGGWDWFIREYGRQITTYDIDGANCMFCNCSSLEEIPFALNFSTYPGNWNNSMQLFSSCLSLRSIPPMTNFTPLQCSQVFQSCVNLRELPYMDIDFSIIDNWGDPWTPTYSQMFVSCASLRTIDPVWLHQPTKCAYYNNLFYYGFQGCAVLDELVDVPFPESLRQDFGDDQCYWDGNGFNYSFDDCYRLSRLKFKEYPVGLKMTNQFIDLAPFVGWSGRDNAITDYNSGIAMSDIVENADDYARLKDTENWWTNKIEFSRYNHTSAVETINSLPDTSQFVSLWGGSNAIQFKGDAGSSTDGGAIRDLPVELINEAAIKGWTVSFV